MAVHPSTVRTGRPGAKRRLAALACLLAGLLASPATAHAVEPGVVPDLTWGISDADQNRTGAAIQDLGARWVRLSIGWNDGEPSQGAYSERWFAHWDRAVRVARQSGARIVMMVYRSPRWASGSSDPHAAPRDNADYARFMAYLATRYRGQVDAYEVWNEQNYARFWPSGPNAAAYTALLRAAYPAVKAADAGARVLYGGLMGSDYTFVERSYAAGAKGYFDAMALHPYTWCNAPSTVRREADGRLSGDVLTAYREVRASMLARGDDKPIWFTEFGWSTSSATCGVSRERQADWLLQAFRTFEADPYVQVALWYNLRNNFFDADRDAYESQFGLLNTDFSPKPAYAAFKAYASGNAPAPPPASQPGDGTAPEDGQRARGRKPKIRLRVSRRAAAIAKAAKRRGGRRSARRGRLQVHGVVADADGGRIRLRVERFNRRTRRWSTALSTTVRVQRHGKFSRTLRISAQGRARVRATYRSTGVDARISSPLVYFRA